MTIEIANQEPKSIQIGLNAQWKIYREDYLPASYVLWIYLLKNDKQISIEGSDYGDNHHFFEVTAAVSALWEEGEYKFQYVAISGSDKWPCGEGSIEITPSFILKTGGHDTRTYNEKVLKAIQNSILRIASKTESEYSINGKSLKRFTLKELREEENIYIDKVAKEKAKAEKTNGRNNGKKILVRFR